MRRHVVLIVLAAISCLGCGIGKQGSCGTFVSQETGSQIQITTVQRIPTWWGGEEYVYAQQKRAAFESRNLEIDINGRFCEKVHVDVSRDGHWARVYLDVVPPWVGEVVPIDGGVGGYQFKAHGSGETTKQERFPYTVVAYIDFPSGAVLRYSTATDVERGSILGLVHEVPAVQQIHERRIEWLATSKQ